MARALLFMALLITSCSKPSQADLPAVAEARSLGAEWALVNEEAEKGHLTSAYVEMMRAALRKQLQASARSIEHARAPYALEIAALLREPPDAAPGVLRDRVNRLKQQEELLESA